MQRLADCPRTPAKHGHPSDHRNVLVVVALQAKLELTWQKRPHRLGGYEKSVQRNFLPLPHTPDIFLRKVYGRGRLPLYWPLEALWLDRLARP